MSIVNRHLWFLLATGIATITACATTPERPPNVIVILVDDLRWDDLGITGQTFAKTPAIDRLASEGRAS